MERGAPAGRRAELERGVEEKRRLRGFYFSLSRRSVTVGTFPLKSNAPTVIDRRYTVGRTAAGVGLTS